jgi:hypothetical protein
LTGRAEKLILGGMTKERKTFFSALQAGAVLAVTLGCGLTAGCKAGSPYTGSGEDDRLAGQTGEWEKSIPDFEATYHVRPPGETYGASDGSTWQDAFSGLPEVRERGARYLFAAGDYFDPSLDRVENYVLDDPDDEDRYIGLIRATADDHGSDVGWDPAFAEGSARMGPLSFVTGHWVVDGRRGSGTEGYGIHISHRDCDLRATEFVASPVFFPWNSETTHLVIRYVDIEDCGDHSDPDTRSQDAIYAVVGPSRFVLRNSHVHDSWRNHFFLQGSFDVLIQDVHFVRAGQHHESSSIALRDTRNVVIHRNVFLDSVNDYISLQSTRNVFITSNVLTRSLPGWDNWAGIHSGQAEKNVLIAGNTFYNLSGLNVGIRFDGDTENLRVVNNLWAGCRANQIMLDGDHHHNAFWDNMRVDGAEPVSLDERIVEDDVQVLVSDPFFDATAYDLHLAHPTAAGAVLDDPFSILDLDMQTRGGDGTWDRGAYEHAEP